MPVVLNAANEVAVEKFLKDSIKFNSIPKLIERMMEKHRVIPHPDINQILDADKWTRQEAEKLNA